MRSTAALLWLLVPLMGGCADRPVDARQGASQHAAPDTPDLGLPSARLDRSPAPRDAEPSRRSGAPLSLDLPRERAARPERVATAAPDAPAGPVDLVRISVGAQRLELWSGDRLVEHYPVSTAKNGVGSAAGSQRTPLGRHRVCAKFGAGEPLGRVFETRRPTSVVATIHTAPVDLPEDVITTRILWLEGLEPGKNRGKGVDSKDRTIYIHGTNEEGLIGTPASHGCVRMRNADVLEVFERVAEGTAVEIVP